MDNKLNLSDEELKKSVEEILEAALKSEETEEETSSEDTVEKAMPMTSVANGKVQTPNSESLSTKAAEKKQSEMKKAEEDDKEDEDSKEDKMEDKKEKLKKKMKKSLDELAELLTEDELELVKAWREENEEVSQIIEESISKSEETISKSSGLEDISSIIESKFESLTKAMSEKDDIIKSLKETVDRIASQPAYDRKSISGLEPVEKSIQGQSSAPEISKDQIADRLLELQLAGENVGSRDVAEFEATNNISNARVKSLVMESFKKERN